MTDPNVISAIHQSLVNALTIPGQTSSNPALLSPGLAAIINVWPTYGATQTSYPIIDIPYFHRYALIGLMGNSLMQVNNGFFQNYFFSNLSESLGTYVLLDMTPQIDWKNFGIALLTDAMRMQRDAENACLNGAYLQTDITRFNNQLSPLLAQTYATMYTNILKLSDMLPNTPNDCDNLKAAILNGQFNDEISNAVNEGGDAALEAEWFLFNLWTLLAVLGESDVDTAIKSFIAAGLTVPSEVGSTKWSTTYTQWFNPLTGLDLVPMVAPQLNQELVDKGGMFGVPVYCYVLTGTPYFALSECAQHMYKHNPPT